MAVGAGSEGGGAVLSGVGAAWPNMKTPGPADCGPADCAGAKSAD